MDQCVEEKGDPESEDYMVRTSSLSTPSKFYMVIFMWLFLSGQVMTVKIKVMHDKKARLPGAWIPMHVHPKYWAVLVAQEELSSCSYFQFPQRNLLALKNIFGFSKSGQILSCKRAKNIKVEKQTEDNIYEVTKMGRTTVVNKGKIENRYKQ